MDLWQQDAKTAWERTRGEGGFSWACWTARMRCARQVGKWVVCDANDKEVMRTDIEPLARLIALLPELLEPDLRTSVIFVRTAGGDDRVIPDVAVGTMTVQEAYDRGYRDGWQSGSDDMERTIDETDDSGILLMEGRIGGGGK